MVQLSGTRCCSYSAHCKYWRAWPVWPSRDHVSDGTQLPLLTPVRSAARGRGLRLVLHVVRCALHVVQRIYGSQPWTSQARQKREDVDYDSIESMDVELVNTHLCKLIQVTCPLL
jgi:hypothetical protein